MAAVLVLARKLQTGQGVLEAGGKKLEVFPKNANYTMLYVTCAVVAAVLIATAVLGELADLPSAQIREILAYVYRAPLEKRRDPSIHWLLIAAHKLTLPLLDRLDPADARALGERYGADYPRRTRLPAQDQVFAALKG